MILVSPTAAILFFALLIIGAAILAWWLGNYSDYDSGRFHTFIAIMAGVAVFVTFMFYYNIVALQNQQQEITIITETFRINDGVIDSILYTMQKASLVVPNFVLSLTPLTNTVCCSTGTTGTNCQIPVGEDPLTPEACTQKMNLSYRIFDLWRDVITSNKIIKFDTLSYVTHFLQYANSSQLYAQWSISYINFDSKTQTFGNLLFQYGLPITIQTPQEYVDVANNLIANPAFQALLT